MLQDNWELRERLEAFLHPDKGREVTMKNIDGGYPMTQDQEMCYDVCAPGLALYLGQYLSLVVLTSSELMIVSFSGCRSVCCLQYIRTTNVRYEEGLVVSILLLCVYSFTCEI